MITPHSSDDEGESLPVSVAARLIAAAMRKQNDDNSEVTAEVGRLREQARAAVNLDNQTGATTDEYFASKSVDCIRKAIANGCYKCEFAVPMSESACRLISRRVQETFSGIQVFYHKIEDIDSREANYFIGAYW